MRIITKSKEYYEILFFIVRKKKVTVKEMITLSTSNEVKPEDILKTEKGNNYTYSALKQKIEFLDGTKEQGIKLLSYEKKGREKIYSFNIEYFLQEFFNFYIDRLSESTKAIITKHFSKDKKFTKKIITKSFIFSRMLSNIEDLIISEFFNKLYLFFPEVEDYFYRGKKYSIPKDKCKIDIDKKNYDVEMMKTLLTFYNNNNTKEKTLYNLFNFMADLVSVTDFTIQPNNFI